MNERLEILVDNASLLSKTDQKAFAMVRRMGFGASDASILLGVNPFPNGTIKLLIEQKRSETLTADEVAIGQMVNVRKGSDLEPLILQKFIDITGLEVMKPEAMYRIKEFPFLTINFDGITTIDGQLIPVECKFVSMYGNKYWEMNKACTNWQENSERPYMLGGADTIFKDLHMAYGPPDYYITQMQQQLLALKAPYGFFSVIFDKGWEHAIFKIYNSELAKNQLITEGYKCWNEIQRLR